jgi:two-component system, OmpR family, response regulator
MKVVIVGVEDEILEQVSRSLAFDGGFLLTECRMAEALPCVARIRPDLVLIDVDRPELEGLDLARRLRQDRDTAGIAVAFLTACRRSEDLAAYAAAGAVDVVAKPFDPRALPGRLRAALAAEPAPPATSVEPLPRHDYWAELSAHVRAIEEALPGLPALAPSMAQQAAILAHRLAGAAAAFGMDQLSEAARTLEDALGRSLLEDAESDRRRIKVLVGELRRRADDHLVGGEGIAELGRP